MVRARNLQLWQNTHPVTAASQHCKDLIYLDMWEAAQIYYEYETDKSSVSLIIFLDFFWYTCKAIGTKYKKKLSFLCCNINGS